MLSRTEAHCHTVPQERTHSFVGLLLADLERQFSLERNGKRANGFQLIKRCLHPRFLPLIFCRLSRAALKAKVPVLPGLFSYLNLVLFGLQITPRCEIGPGLFLPHPCGTVIGAWRIGSNVTLFQQVTLGAKDIDLAFTADLLPEICDNVVIGAGAKVLGGITIGDSSVIGANAVVLRSVASKSIAVGVPARIIPRNNYGEFDEQQSIRYHDYRSEL